MRTWLVLLLAVLLIAGCGESDKAATTEKKTTTAQEDTDADGIVDSQDPDPYSAQNRSDADRDRDREPAERDAETACGVLLAVESKGGTCDSGDGTFTIARAGQPTRQGDVGLRVKSVRLANVIPAGFDGAKPSKAQGRFAIMRVRVSNHGDSPLDWANELDGRTLLLAGTRQFPHDGEAEANLPGTLDNLGNPIPPGEGRDLWMVYRVSAGSVADVRDGFVLFVSTQQLRDGDTPDTASEIGMARVPG